MGGVVWVWWVLPSCVSWELSEKRLVWSVFFWGALLLDRSGGLGKVRAMSSWKRSDCDK